MPKAANASRSCKDVAKSSLLIPTAFANASCSILFIFVKSAADPTWVAISSATPAKLLFKANCLAFSKLKSLFSKSSASNSFDIEDSKSSKLPAILSTWDNSIPNFLALIAAFTSSVVELPILNWIDAEDFAISSTIFFSLIADLFWPLKAAAVPKALVSISSVDFPVKRDNLTSSAAESAWYPACLVNSNCVFNVSLLNPAVTEKRSANWPKLSFKFLVVTKTFSEVCEIAVNSLFKFLLWL